MNNFSHIFNNNFYDLITKYNNTVSNNFQTEYEFKSLLMASINYLILDTKILKTNRDVYILLKEIFELDFKDYIVSSRTLMLGHTTRYILEIDSLSKLEMYLNKINRFMTKTFDSKNINYLDNLRDI